MQPNPNSFQSVLIKYVLKLMRVCAILYILYCVLFFWQISLDDGPFTGIPRSECPTRNADQEFSIIGNNSLLVYDPLDGEDAPTVALKRTDNSIAWCIFATGLEKTKVTKLRFSRLSSPIPFLRPVVRGQVFWSYGLERMTWSIDYDGTLYWYRYSW